MHEPRLPPSATKHSDIIAGATLSLSGRFAVQGEQARRGLELWAEHLNDAGGLVVDPAQPPRPITLRVYDDGSTRAGATAATQRLILEDRVQLLFSPYSSVLALAAAHVSERHGRVLWNHGGSSDAIDRAGFQRVVSFLTPASGYFTPVLDLAAHVATQSGRPAPSVALLYGATGTFPHAVAEGARTHAARLGLAILLDQPYQDHFLTPPAPLSGAERGERAGAAQVTGAIHCAPTEQSLVGAQFIAPPEGEVPSLLQTLTEVDPDLILGVGTTEADLAFACQLSAAGLTSPLVALVAAPIEHFREALGSAADGFVGPSQWEPSGSSPARRPDLGPTSAEFVAAFRSRFGVEPDYPAAQAYAAGLVAAHAVAVAGTLDDAAVRAAAATLDLTTFYGRFRLDPDSGRQVGHEMVVVQWQSGQKQVVWPPAEATAPIQLPTAAPTSRPFDADASS